MVRLYVESSRLVGYGRSYPDRRTHHTIPLPADQIVVTVVVVREDAPLPLPESDEVDTVQQATNLGYFIAWPCRLVDMVRSSSIQCSLLLSIYANHRKS